MHTQNTIPNRDCIGRRTGWLGLCGNLFLVLIKLMIGYYSNSIAIIADALNNLTDCASSIVTIAGFYLAAKGKDEKHPYGHGRMEYICGFMISNFILVTAISVGKDAIKRLLSPQDIKVSYVVIITLIISIFTKLFMAWVVNRLNKKLSSPALKAIRNDNLSDTLVTTVTLLGILFIPFTDLPLDGFLGLLVSLSILWSGITSFRENLVLLLGEGINPETEQEIRQLVLEYELFKDINMITLHDYGPAEKLAFIKVIFQQSPHSPEATQTLELVKQRLKSEMQLNATLYWDTIDKSLMKGGHTHEQQKRFH